MTQKQKGISYPPLRSHSLWQDYTMSRTVAEEVEQEFILSCPLGPRGKHSFLTTHLKSTQKLSDQSEVARNPIFWL